MADDELEDLLEDDASPERVPLELLVTETLADCRLDWYLAQQFTSHSRTNLRRAINNNDVRIDGRRAKASHRVQPGERITVILPDPVREGPRPENIPIEILYEDTSLAIVNKPPGMVVHPGRGHWTGTLAAALTYHFQNLSSLGGPTRPGIVHRLDRDTSGILVIAKTDQAHQHLSLQFENRTVEKEYFALVAGQPRVDRDNIDLPIGIHPYQREKMAIRRDDPTAKHAISFYEVRERFNGFAAVRIAPKTGRTHQIRVHLASIGCPVLCDRLYGGRARITRGELRHRLDDETVLLGRQALHAFRLAIDHPLTGERLHFEAPLPADMQLLLDALREFRGL